MMRILILLYSLHLSPVLQAEINIAVASNFNLAAKALAVLYQSQGGEMVRISLGPTGSLYAKIEYGAPFELFLAADSERLKRLEQAGEIVSNSRFSYALGKLLLWSPTPDYVDSDGQILLNGNFKHLAIANPKLAPYGSAAQEVLEHLKYWQTLQQRLVRGENIGQSFQFIQSGNVELGFIAASQYQALGKTGSVWHIPVHLYSPIAQQAVLLKDTSAARHFWQFLHSGAAKMLIKNLGYGIPE